MSHRKGVKESHEIITQIEKPKKKKKKKKVKKGQDQKEKKTPKTGLETLMNKAERALNEGNFTLVFENLQRILQAQPNYIPALELQSHALRDSGRLEEAYEVLQKCVSLAPNEFAKNWMALGELQMGPDAVGSFKRGIEIMTKELAQLQLELKAVGTDVEESMMESGADSKQKSSKKNNREKAIRQLERELSSGYVSVAELYTTDLVDEEKAEAQCEKLLQQAISICPHNPEARRALSELRLVQSNTEQPMEEGVRMKLVQQAVGSLETCIQLLNAEREADENYSAYDFKLNVAKLAMDLKQFQAAVDLIEVILREDDTVLEAWYVAGMAYLRVGDARSAVDYLSTAAEKFAKESSEFELNEDEKGLQTNVLTALREAQEIVKGLPPEPEDEETGLGEDDDMDTESMSNSFSSTSLSTSTPAPSSSSSTSFSPPPQKPGKTNEAMEDD